jgi:predicted DNA-binding transcriptional regulator AlpA
MVRVMGNRDDVLPKSLAPRGLSRMQAAAYIGVSPSLFDEMVKDGRMPQPMRINARAVWDRVKLDEAFAALSDGGSDGSNDPWGSVSV